MIYLVTLLSALSASMLVLALTAWVSEDGRVLKKQLAQLQIPKGSHAKRSERRMRRRVGMKVARLMEAMGQKVALGHRHREGVRTWLLHAGFRREGAVHVFVMIRMILSVALGAVAVFFLTTLGAAPGMWFLVTAIAALTGYMLPFLLVKRRAKRRQYDIQRAIPDVLDLLVVCVEAGLGLNQALYRVAQEIDAVSTETAEELAITNLEIRAGTPRMDALRGLATRTGLDDMSALVSMLVQTDRFGTSISRALRVHSDSLRTKRRQRVEEQAAKTSIQMVFPLALFIFPSIFVVLLGPAIFMLKDVLGGLS